MFFVCFVEQQIRFHLTFGECRWLDLLKCHQCKLCACVYCFKLQAAYSFTLSVQFRFMFHHLRTQNIWGWVSKPTFMTREKSYTITITVVICKRATQACTCMDYSNFQSQSCIISHKFIIHAKITRTATERNRSQLPKQLAFTPPAAVTSFCKTLIRKNKITKGLVMWWFRLLYTVPLFSGCQISRSNLIMHVHP